MFLLVLEVVNTLIPVSRYADKAVRTRSQEVPVIEVVTVVQFRVVVLAE